MLQDALVHLPRSVLAHSLIKRVMDTVVILFMCQCLINSCMDVDTGFCWTVCVCVIYQKMTQGYPSSCNTAFITRPIALIHSYFHVWQFSHGKLPYNQKGSVSSLQPRKSNMHNTSRDLMVFEQTALVILKYRQAPYSESDLTIYVL